MSDKKSSKQAAKSLMHIPLYSSTQNLCFYHRHDDELPVNTGGIDSSQTAVLQWP